MGGGGFLQMAQERKRKRAEEMDVISKNHLSHKIACNSEVYKADKKRIS